MNNDAAILFALKGQPDLAERLSDCWPVHLCPGGKLEHVEAHLRANIRVLVTSGSVGATADLIAALPALRLIACLGSGYENVDVAAARAGNIAVTYSPGANASSVADLAIGLMIASVRQLVIGDRFVRDRQWPIQQKPRGMRGLTGRRLGILGLGAIGEKIARRAAALEMEIAYHNRSPRADVAWRYIDTLPALASYADILMIACRADHSTRGLVDAAILDRLGPDGHIVNISRGSVIDEPALIAALRSGAIAGAGLDVFAQEPYVPDELLTARNVVLTPHLGGGTLEASNGTADLLFGNVEAFFAGSPLPNVIPELRGCAV